MDLSKTHVVHVVRQYSPNIGGLEDFVANLTARQFGRFASVKVITLDRLFRDPATVLPHHVEINGVEVHRIPFHGSSRYPIAPSILRELDGADLVHVHAVDFFFDALAITRFWHRKPLVATTHGGFFHTKNDAMLKKIWFNTLTRFSARQYRQIACCSESDLQQFARIAPKRVSLIENGVDLKKFENASAKTPARHLVTLGRMSRNKRLDRVLDVLACLNSGDQGWNLDIIGAESDLTVLDLERMITERSLEGKVSVHTGLDDEGVTAVIGNASLFVSASEYEGFGIALIEAMSAGLIPIVHPNEAFQAFAQRHEEIALADYSKPDEAAETIHCCFDKMTAGQTLRENVERASSAYGWSIAAERYDELYARALAQ
ncbi:MAG: glycosyltransferase family 4 protein [Roseibium sp.]